MDNNEKIGDGVEVFMFCDEKTVSCCDLVEINIDIRNNTSRYICAETLFSAPRGMRFVRGRVDTPIYSYPLLRLGSIKLGELLCGQAAKICLTLRVTGEPSSEIITNRGCRPRKIPAFFLSCLLRYCKRDGGGEECEKESNIITLISGSH